MFNYKIIIAYDGTNYCGWQKQPNEETAQEVLERTIAVPLRQQVNIVGASRTDSGVHAKGQVGNFLYDKKIHFSKFLISVNALLPKDIRVKEVELVSDDFNSRFFAKWKIYQYHLWLDKVQDPFSHRYSYHVFKKIDLELLQKAANLLVGTHDFTSFGNIGGATKENCIRTIKRIDIKNRDGGVYLEFEGNGFLYKMIRNITGTLLEVASGKRPINDIELILKAKDRRKAGQAAPAHGLCLIEVKYFS